MGCEEILRPGAGCVFCAMVERGRVESAVEPERDVILFEWVWGDEGARVALCWTRTGSATDVPWRAFCGI